MMRVLHINADVSSGLALPGTLRKQSAHRCERNQCRSPSFPRNSSTATQHLHTECFVSSLAFEFGCVHAMRGADIGRARHLSTVLCASAMPCPVLTSRMLLLGVLATHLTAEVLPIVLRACYAVSGTDVAYAATICYAVSGTDVGLAATIFYVVSGTDMDYATTVRTARLRYLPLSAHALLRLCPVPLWAMAYDGTAIGLETHCTDVASLFIGLYPLV
eukprot:1559028-Rhodomonas_salina.4